MRKSLTRQERIRQKGEVDLVFRTGSTFRCRGLVMRCRPNGLAWSRVLVVSPRSTGTAVRRNRLRRIGKEIFRTIKPMIRGGNDFVFVVYAGDFSFLQRREQFLRLLADANALTPR
ncbi:MAG: ribonuclease P protein component [Spirochaetaceae bacterium]|nr:MAG: ribonuclease P protein component [Spirochaetaceae bacterium]